MGDTLTFLRGAGVVGAKTFTPAGPIDYACGAGPFEALRAPIASLADLLAILSQCPIDAYHVRGRPAGDEQIIPYRRHRAHGLEPASLVSEAHCVLPIDYDGKDPEYDGRELEQNARTVRGLLPETLALAACVAQATSSAGVKPGIRVRLWFLLDAPIDDAAAKRALEDAPVDLAIYTPSQPIYCAPPVFRGLADPYAGRSRLILLEGGEASAAALLAAKPAGIDSPLAGIGAARPAAPLDAPIADGGRNNALTSLAGALRRKGASAETILAALRQHNAERCSPPLPDDEIARIAASLERYTPEELTVALRPDDKKARKALKAQCARLRDDPELLDDANLRIAPHVASGALTSNEVASAFARALGDADQVVPITRDELRARVLAAPAIPTPVAQPWATAFKTNGEGGIAYGPENLRKLFEIHPDVAVRYDERARQVIWDRSPLARVFEDRALDAELRAWVDRELGWPKCPIPPCDALLAVAQQRSFDPWLDYLQSLAWDGVQRLDSAAPRLLGTRTEAERITFALWLLGAVARTYEPGCKVDTMIVLEGSQGIGKTTFLRELAVEPRYYSRLTTSGDLANARVIGKLHGPVIVEVAELAALSRRDALQTKAFLDEQIDRWQPLYARGMIETPRRCVFAATTNDNEYLHDITGARRFWPIKCGTIDVPALVAERAQLWAEAREYYRAGVPRFLTHEQEIALGMREVREERREREQAEDALTEQLRVRQKPGLHPLTQLNWETWQLDEQGYPIALTTAQIASLLDLHPVRDNRTISRTMQALGWARRRDGMRRHWQAPDAKERGTWKETTTRASN